MTTQGVSMTGEREDEIFPLPPQYQRANPATAELPPVFLVPVSIDLPNGPGRIGLERYSGSPHDVITFD